MADPQAKFVISAEDRATATLKKVSAEFGGLGAAATRAATLLTTFGGALSIGAVAAAFKSVVDLQDEMGKLSQRVGIGVESLNELNYAAKLSDVSTEELSTGVTRLTSKMAEVAKGSKEAAAVFDSLGVKVQNSDGSLRSSEEVLKDIAQRFSEFSDGATKTAYATEIFGRAGAKLIPMLNAGRDGLAEMGDEARALGVVFDEKAAKAAERFNDNLTRLGQAAQGLKIELLQGLVPGLTEITQRFIEARAAGISFIDSLDIAANIRGFGTLEEKIADVQRRLEGAKSGQWTGLFSNDVKGLQAELEKLLALRRRVENRETAQFSGSFNGALLARGAATGAPPPMLRGPQAAAGAARQSEADKYLDALRKQSDAMETLTAYEKLMNDLQVGRLGKVSEMQLQQLASVAHQIDAQKELNDAKAREVDIQKVISEALQRDDERLKSQADHWLDVIDPVRKYVQQLEQIRTLVREGKLTPQQGIAAEFDVQGKIQDTINPVAEQTKKATDAAKELGLTFQSAFEDAIVGGKGLSGVLQGIAKDVARIWIRESITKPFVSWLSGMNLFGGLFGGARAGGGDVMSSKAYLVGERGPELFVPKSAGTIVPNGKTGGVTISQSFVFQGNASRAEGYALAQRVKAETIAAMREANYRNDLAVTG